MKGTSTRHPWRHVFLSVPVSREFSPSVWAAALAEERRLRGEGAQAPLRTLHVGHGGGQRLGGALPALVCEILDHARSFLPEEWTVEVTDPRPLTPSVVHQWVQGGVNRIVLRGRAASSAQGTPLVEALKGAGVLKVSVDLRIPASRRRVARWLASGVDQITLAEPEGSEAPAGWRQVHDQLRSAGWTFWDPISASASAVQWQGSWGGSRVRRAILVREPVLGLGPGAVTSRGRWRGWNIKGWTSYLSRVQGGRPPIQGSEALTTGEVRLERVWGALHTLRGVRIPHGPWSGPLDRLMGRLEEAGWGARVGRRFVLTPDGWLRLDGIAVDWLRALDHWGDSTRRLRKSNFEG
jgi:coproporphyrinogen III oxidase-like Fe-S oxidoreductase